MSSWTVVTMQCIMWYNKKKKFLMWNSVFRCRKKLIIEIMYG